MVYACSMSKRKNLISWQKPAGYVDGLKLDVSEPTHPRPYGTQPQAYHALKDKKHVILNAPTGWGKSFVMAMLVAYTIGRHPRLRCIIAVPQTVIADGFLQSWKLKIGRKLIDWVVQHNLCGQDPRQTIPRLIDFLRGRHGRMGDRVLLCTHATLALAYCRLKKRRRLGLFKNTILWIDEAHHVKNAQIEGGGTDSNTLGALVKYCVKRGNYVGLATATWIRGDSLHILSDTMAEQFTRHHVPFDVYLETMRPIESFEFNIICGQTLKGLKSLFRKKCPTIIYLAKRQSRHATRCKYLEVKDIIRLLAKGRPVRHGIFIQVGGLKILDLVDEKGREAKKTYLDNGGKDEIDVIIALDTCKEGFNWTRAERSIILGERHSIPEMIQMIGRLFRRHPGKTHAEVHQIIPAAVRNSKDFKDQQNSILSVIFATMLLEDVFFPVMKGRRKTTRLLERIRDGEALKALMGDFLDAAANGYKASLRLAPSVLKKHGITAEWRQVWDRLWKQMAIRTRRMKGLQLDVSFEVLKKTDIAGGMLRLASDLCGAMTFKELRRVIGRGFKTVEQWVVVAEKLAEDNGGVLQNSKWLCMNTFSGLCEAKRNNPDLFAHIPQDRKWRPPEEWVPIAESRAKKSGGVLPAPTELIKDCPGLNSPMRHHPDLFAHIPQDKKLRSPEEWVPIAESRAKKNGGVLENSTWLIENGLSGLDQAKRNHSDLFSHIPQDKKLRSPEEWVPIAEQMAKKNGDVLQTQQWLIENDLGSLVQAKRHHPDLFDHIPQEPHKRGRSPEKWVPVAEQEAKKNGGKLPINARLQENGLLGFIQARRAHPDLFDHIPQESHKRSRSPEKWVPVAERLAEENGGILQNATWLSKRYSGLYHDLIANPEAFAHIPRQRRRTLEEQVAAAKQLAKENGGVLPQNLGKKGHHGIVQAMRKHPESFAHILQQQYRFTLKEYVSIAEQLAKENNGVLPSGLERKGYHGLQRSKRENPQAFAHIKQDAKFRSPLEWAAIAKQLAKENGGVLPAPARLKENGLDGLNQAKRIHPKFFKGIEQDKKYHSPEEWVPIAEQLAKDNGGMLPNLGWLEENGLLRLHHAKRKHPKLFKHIPQQRRKR